MLQRTFLHRYIEKWVFRSICYLNGCYGLLSDRISRDLHLSNESKKDRGGNDVDGSWGDWTLQEGENDIFMINNRNGKKYKINLTEV